MKFMLYYSLPLNEIVIKVIAPRNTRAKATLGELNAGMEDEP